MEVRITVAIYDLEVQAYPGTIELNAFGKEKSNKPEHFLLQSCSANSNSVSDVV